MITLADSSVLWLLLPLAIGLWSFATIQRRALAWLERHVAARFRRRFSVYTRVSLARHLTLVAVMGALLVVAAGGPSRPGEAEVETTGGRLLFLVDGSASMYASDAEAIFPGNETPKSRLELARRITLDMADRLEGFRFALASYSGSAVINLPMISDVGLLKDALLTLENHNYYVNTGSSLSRALDVAIHFADPDQPRLQVVMLGDGELPREEDFDAALAALRPQGIVVHTIAIGSTAGENRVIYDLRDIIQKKDDPTVLRQYSTRRVDRHFERIAKRTGGSFTVAAPGAVERLAEEIRSVAETGRSIVHEKARKDLSPWLLGAFLGLFLIDSLVGGRRRPEPAGFDLERLGPNPTRRSSGSRAPATPRAAKATLFVASVLPALLLWSCADTPRKLAHRENEQGIREDAFMRFAEARPHYERSRSFGIEAQIPTHNLARSVAMAGDVSEAHDLFQEAMTLDPELAEALFNDGVTLWFWGEAERDPKDCDLERTRELWLEAAARFASTASLKTASAELADQARANHRFAREALREVGQLIADPPPHCLSKPEEDATAAGAGDAESEPEDQDAEPEGESGGEDESESPENEPEDDPQNQPEEEPERGEGETDPEAQGQDGEDEDEGGTGGDQNENEGEGDEGEDGEEEAEGEGGGGANGDGSPQGSQEDSGGGQLSEQELAEIGELIRQIAERGREGGRYHRKTQPEQFSPEDWGNPDAELWW